MNSANDLLPLIKTVAPANQEGVAEEVRRAREARTALYPIGGGTQLACGLRPESPGIGLSLAGLARVVDYPARDLTITVEAGLPWAALAKTLSAEGQRLPVDVPRPERATVGGAVASGAAGPRQLRWGSMRDCVIGLRAIDGTGTAFAAGGRVVKNAAGYDLCRLLTGSFGALGVIVQVTFMVKPMPEASAFVACEVPDDETAEDLLARLIRTRALPCAVELLAGPAWQQDPALGPMAQSEGLRLLVGVEGSRAEVEWMIAQLVEEWRQAGVTSPSTVTGDQAEPLWARLTEFAGPSGGDGAWPLVVQINVLPGKVVRVFRCVREVDRSASIQAHAASGVVLARLAVPASEAAQVIDRRLRPEVISAGGHLLVLAQAPGSAMSGETVFGPRPSAWAVMQSIEERFDPEGILNRGRFLYPWPT